MGPKILAVDDDRPTLNFIRMALEDEGYSVIPAESGAEALELALTNPGSLDLALLDWMMPEMSGYQLCKALKANPATERLPVIFLTAASDNDDEAYGFDAGAVDFIHKPISVPILIRRLQTHLSLVHARELEASYRQTIYMLGEAGHYNDTDTGVHIWRMAAYAQALAKAAGWPDRMVERLGLAAPMHDMGKIGIPGAILRAPRPLTAGEWEVMKGHCEIGFNILSKSDGPVFRMAAEIALNHHEKWNGGGYPFGLAGTEIPEAARIVAVADVFDALTMSRPYKKAWDPLDALREIENNSGSHFEPRLVSLFGSIVPEIMKIFYRMNFGIPDCVV